jgi:adenylate kinase
MKHQLIFLGSPGAGKGTMAQKLAQHLSIPHISTGDIFRANIKNKTDLGLQVEAITAGGALVPDSLTIALVEDRLQEADAQMGYILDGFPRTLVQAQALSTFANISMAINFEIAQDLVIARLSGRLTCPNCNQSYHKTGLPPKQQGICDACGHALLTRKDDTIQAISHRLDVYQKETAPLIGYYQERNLLQNLNSAQEMSVVFDQLLALIAATK